MNRFWFLPLVQRNPVVPTYFGLVNICTNLVIKDTSGNKNKTNSPFCQLF
ncbi:hypothetical protein TERTU_0795 [Teredinibacter turnerae T7901]|uniref:Uncharacterized protein n=1 Tax=Teredinibacter turnerae (strain ATCC 39867 / T7901) TaxID=377629 RepID=C5BPI0_TERTT|nr:hypothetical protein TERTU_0795 [Teredinibacter turnerae T7901]